MNKKGNKKKEIAEKMTFKGKPTQENQCTRERVMERTKKVEGKKLRLTAVSHKKKQESTFVTQGCHAYEKQDQRVNA